MVDLGQLGSFVRQEKSGFDDGSVTRKPVPDFTGHEPEGQQC